MKSIACTEFDSYLKEHGLESYSLDVVKGWVDMVEKSEELTPDELVLFRAEFMSLSPVEVVGENLEKSLYLVRPSQTEKVIEKSITVYKDTPLNRFRGVVGFDVTDRDSIEKSLKEAVGVKKKYADGRVYQKTAGGWKPVAEGNKKPEKTKMAPSGRDQSKNLHERIIEAVKRMSDGEIKVFLKNKEIQGDRRDSLMKEAKKRGIM